MFGSSRSGGVRGGQDQFNWDDVKVDKHRENYLGKFSQASRQIANGCVRTCDQQSKTPKITTTQRGVSTPHVSFSLPFVVESLITNTQGWCSGSVLVQFLSLHTAAALFYCSLSPCRPTYLLREPTPLSTCQHYYVAPTAVT